MKKIIVILSLYLFPDITSVSGQCGINILTNPGFDAPVQPNSGNNIINSFSFNGWTMTGGLGFNIVRPDGSYSAGPDNAKDGTQYIEVAFGNGTVYQDFTLVGPSTSISFGGYYSSRTGGSWTTGIEIYSMPADSLMATSNILQYISQGNKVWLYAHGNVTLNAGNYRFVANIPDDANFDASFVYTSCLLPIKLVSFSAALQNTNNTKLQWQISTSEEGSKYELLRCTDGYSFLPINLQSGNSSLTQFNYTDNTLPNGTYYYRLKITDKDGKVTYSNIAIVKVGSKDQWISIYPNPINRGESLQISLQNITANKIEIMNAAGQLLYNSTAKQTGSFSLPISSVLTPGQYVVRVVNENTVDVQKIIVQ